MSSLLCVLEEQRDAERKMLISAGGMRDQREQLEEELLRLSAQQEQVRAPCPIPPMTPLGYVL